MLSSVPCFPASNGHLMQAWAKFALRLFSSMVAFALIQVPETFLYKFVLFD